MTQGRAAGLRMILSGVCLVALASLAACDEQEPLKPTCALAADSPDREAVETRCDGIDNDCDGLTDVLPVDEANACASDSCQPGQFACIGSERTCLVPALADETVDGIDNDCDGQTASCHPPPPCRPWPASPSPLSVAGGRHAGADDAERLRLQGS